MSGFISYPYLVSAGAAAGFSAEAQQFFNRVSDPGTTRKTLYATMIDAIVAAGVWTKLDALWVFAAADATTALTNLVSSSYGATEVNAPSFTIDVGYQLNVAANRHIDTGFDPTSGTPHFVQDSACLFAWSNTSVAQSRSFFGTATRNWLYSRFTDDTAYYRCNHLSDDVTSSETDGKGFYTASRTASNLITGYKNGASVDSSAVASIALASANFITGENSTTIPGNQILCCGVGGGLNGSEILALYNALHSYLQTVAGIA